MNDEKLIELVRKHPALYNVYNPKYMDSGYKMNVWKQISQELKVDDITHCKTRWNNIRDNYRKFLRKLTIKKGQSVKRMKIYKYSQQLKFLNKFIEEKKSNLNIEIPEDLLYETDNLAMTENDDSLSQSVTDEVNTVTTEDINNMPINQIASNKTAPLQEATLSTLIINPNEIQSQRTPVHPIDAFLTSIAPTLKTLNPYYLNLAKSEIFATVQKYEMKMLMQQHQVVEDKSTMKLSPCSSTHFNLNSKTSSPSPTPKPSQSEHSES